MSSVNTKVRISYLALLSLVMGMAFYIPIASGGIAVVAGLYAINRIKRSEGRLLGRGMAVVGALLGLIHAVLWSLHLYAGMGYVVDEGVTAVVERGDEVVRMEKPGLHYMIPYVETVTHYPTDSIFEAESEVEKYILYTKDHAELQFNVLWKICDVRRFHTNLGYFVEKYHNQMIVAKYKGILRVLASKYNDVDDLSNTLVAKDYMNGLLEEELAEYGICPVMTVASVKESK